MSRDQRPGFPIEPLQSSNDEKREALGLEAMRLRALASGLDDRTIEIKASNARRLTRTVMYLILFVGVAAALAAMFIYFTGSLRIAVALVTFMVGYMLIMAWITGRGWRP